MSFDPHFNFAYSTVATAPSPATSGTSLVLSTGDGVLFPAPGTDGHFNLTIWPTGVAPTKANAEIVRVTARSTDTLTITRTQEGTSARTIVVGDQVALTITAKVITDIEASSTNPSVVLVPPATGVAATDTAAIQDAITACPTGGIVQLAATDTSGYALTGSTPLTIGKALTLRGTGGANTGVPADVWAHFGTLLTYNNATGVAITISEHGVQLENFALENTATTPTAGAGIQTVTGGGNSTYYGPNLCVRGFYINIDHQAGGQWTMDPSVFLMDFAEIGLRIQNVDGGDYGDFVLSGMFYAGPNHTGVRSAIQWQSGGGGKCHSLKINNLSTATCQVGFEMLLQDGIATVDMSLVNSSIENVTDWCFLLQHGGVTHSGTFKNIMIYANEFQQSGSLSSQGVIAIAPASGSKVSAVNIGGNVLIAGGASAKGINLTNIANASHGPNVFVSGAGYFDGGGNSSITSVGNG